MPRFPPLATAVEIARLTSNAAKPSEPKPNPHSSPKSYKAATCKAGQLQITLLEPFEFAAPLEPTDDEWNQWIGGSGRDFENWLPTLDVFRTLAA